MIIWESELFAQIGVLVFQAVCLLFAAGALVISLYYWFWALVSVLKRKLSIDEKEGQEYCFAICIPAYNEAKVIRDTLKQLGNINYPKDQYDVFVIADNCTDNTATLVREIGFECLERFDREKRGKGFALEWGLDRILYPDCKYHAVVIIDADCYLDTHCLQVFDQYLHSGKHVLQANFKITNCNENPMTFVACLGNFIENSLFYSPKSRIRAACFLQGTGMVISHEVLSMHPWSAYSNAEDLEYSLFLMKEDIGVTFVDDVHVYTLTPSTMEQLQVQRARWASGTITLGKSQGCALIIEGICRRNLRLIDAGVGIMTASRPLMVLFVFFALLFCGLSVWVIPGSVSFYLLVVSSLAALLHIGYYLFGAVKMGVSLERLRLCFGGVGVGVKLVLVACVGLVKKPDEEWKRTPR